VAFNYPALALMRGIDGELAEVAVHHRRQTLLVGACAFQKGFDGEGGVDQRNQTRPDGVGCQTYAEGRIRSGSETVVLGHSPQTVYKRRIDAPAFAP
jgi:hypothetical protein